MPRIPGLRSPHAKVGRIIAFGRVVDKIRLHARGELPAEYQANLGEGSPSNIDSRCCRFLGVRYAELRERVLAGGCDEEVLAWCEAAAPRRSDDDCLIWNRHLSKIGWRDDRSGTLLRRIEDARIEGERPQTIFEFLDADEGRPLGATRSWEGQPLRAVVVMGVAGCGKTTAGRALAEAAGWEFLEADGLHSPGAIAKMAAGTPLDDTDRAPWLLRVRAGMEAACARGPGVVAACSALKAAYRRVLAPDPAEIRFVHLRGSPDLMAGRLRERKGHYMGEGLLRSQFEALEEPVDALALDASPPTDVIVHRIRETLMIP
jgi:gluconokinase